MTAPTLPSEPPMTQDNSTAQLVTRLRALADYLTYEGEDEAAPIVAEAADLIERLTRPQPSTSSVEAVARAISIPEHHTTWDLLTETQKDLYRMQADYAIKALAALPSPEREPMREALGYLESEARRFAGFYPEASDGRNTFVIFADKIAALAPPPAQSGDRT